MQEISVEAFRKRIENERCYALSVQILNYSDQSDTFVLHRYPRIYQNVPELRYRGSVHEQLFYEEAPVECEDTTIKILHVGYTEDIVRKKNKTARNKRILEQNLKTNPTDPFIHLNLANELMKTKEYKKAQKHYAFARINGKKASITSLSSLQEIAALVKTKHYPKAFELMERAQHSFPDYTDLVFMEGELLSLAGREQEASAAFTKCLEMGESPKKYVSTQGVGSLLPLEKLAHLALMNREYMQALGYLADLTGSESIQFCARERSHRPLA